MQKIRYLDKLIDGQGKADGENSAAVGAGSRADDARERCTFVASGRAFQETHNARRGRCEIAAWCAAWVGFVCGAVVVVIAACSGDAPTETTRVAVGFPSRRRHTSHRRRRDAHHQRDTVRRAAALLTRWQVDGLCQRPHGERKLVCHRSRRKESLRTHARRESILRLSRLDARR